GYSKTETDVRAYVVGDRHQQSGRRDASDCLWHAFGGLHHPYTARRRSAVRGPGVGLTAKRNRLIVLNAGLEFSGVNLVPGPTLDHATKVLDPGRAPPPAGYPSRPRLRSPALAPGLGPAWVWGRRPAAAMRREWCRLPGRPGRSGASWSRQPSRSGPADRRRAS